jgi:outer membrane protein OmpA-like peptidoglycan-associated protein
VVLACASTGLTLSACADMSPRVSRAAARATCADQTFPIYFEGGSDQLTAAARQELAYVAAQVKGCRLGEVEVLGLADADGPDARSLELSKRRAAVVAQALAASGLPAPVFDVEALGKLGSRTRSGVPAPLHRRTEVVIHASAA